MIKIERDSRFLKWLLQNGFAANLTLGERNLLLYVDYFSKFRRGDQLVLHSGWKMKAYFTWKGVMELLYFFMISSETIFTAISSLFLRVKNFLPI